MKSALTILFRYSSKFLQYLFPISGETWWLDHVLPVHKFAERL
eukprot:UN07301